MNSSVVDLQVVRAVSVTVSDDTLTLELSDGRTVSVPLGWYPRLLRGTRDERKNWRLIGEGNGVNWPELDEDISVENLLAGQRSGESQSSLQRWLDDRKQKGGANPVSDPDGESG